MSAIKEVLGVINQHTGCSCGCSQPKESSRCAADEQPGHEHDDKDGHSHGECSWTGKGFSLAQKREIGILAVSAILFTIAMIFEHRLEAYSAWAPYAAFALPYFLCGLPIFKEALKIMCKGDIFNEFSLMGFATVAAIILGHLGEAVGVMLFYRTGEFLQDLASASSRGSIKALLASKPSTANVLKNGNVTTEAVESVEPGDIVVVRAGEKIPLDGVVTSGLSQIDTSPLTGESLPLPVAEGSKVQAGCINSSGVIEMRVSSRFADTHMAKILEMVENAAGRKSPTERFITRFARYYTPAVVAAATMVAVLPPLVGGAEWSTWIYRALVLLVISCPCALLISIPLGYFGGIGAASRQGILVKGGNVLDGILHTNMVIFDKTGTLTAGKFSVQSVIPAEGVSEDTLLAAAAQAECESNHPIARSIMQQVRGFERPTDLTVREIAGKGMLAESCGKTYLAGTALFMEENSISAAAVEPNTTIVHVAAGGSYLGYITVADSLKDNAKKAISDLKAQGLQTALLSGDRQAAVEAVAAELGLDTFKAGLMPDQKVEAMEELADPQNITFVGDGINDAPSLAIARVGIAMGGIGSEAAIEAADAVILNDSPAKVAELYNIARKVRVVVWQNIALALGIKGLFMGLGVVGLSGLWEAVFADVGVALLAVLNSVRTMKR